MSTVKKPKSLIRAMSKKALADYFKDFDEIERGRVEQEEREEAERWKPKTETIGKCSCGGDIVLNKTYTSEYMPETGPMIIGPGSRGQHRMAEHRECFCVGCGILYNPQIVKKKRK